MKCSVDGCGRKVLAKSYCSRHYKRWKTYGDPALGGTMVGEPMRFYKEVVLKCESDDCLEWPYTRTGKGRGQIKIDGKMVYVHRLACEAENGPPPTSDYEAAHNCGNGHLGCCNPKHMRWDTRTGNQKDRLAHGTHNRGEKSGKVKVTEDVVLQIRALADSLTHREIAEKFNMPLGSVGGIVKRRRWAWLQPANDNERVRRVG